MKAGVVHAQKDIRYEEIETPVPKAGDILIKVKYTGICGSDVPRVNGTACHFYPNVLGHEFSGTVALHGFKRVPFDGGRTVAVAGGGTIGLFVMQWAKIFGAREAAVFDVLPERLELAKRLGATATVNSADPDCMEQAMALTNGRGFDYVFDNAGVQATARLVFQLAANRANVCMIANSSKPLTFTPEEWECMYRKEFNLTGSWMSCSAPFPGMEWEAVAHYFKTGELQFDDSFIFKKMPLSRIADAFAMYETPGAVKGKILIDSEA